LLDSHPQIRDGQRLFLLPEEGQDEGEQQTNFTGFNSNLSNFGAAN
jgi:hypothetical protein